MVNTSDKRNERRGGFYWVGNTPYVSVTNVLQAIDKPALRRWVGKEVYLAMVKNPNLTESEALAAPYKISDDAKTRGTTIHSIVEAYKESGAEIKPEDAKYAGYAQAFHKWVKDNNMEVIDHEKTVISKKYGFAGTTDMIVRNRQTGEVWVCDVKTGKDIYQEAFLQVSAYKQALIENGTQIDKAGVILLQESGTYKFGESEDYFQYFLATKKLWEFLNRETCKKLGYL